MLLERLNEKKRKQFEVKELDQKIAKENGSVKKEEHEATEKDQAGNVSENPQMIESKEIPAVAGEPEEQIPKGAYSVSFRNQVLNAQQPP